MAANRLAGKLDGWVWACIYLGLLLLGLGLAVTSTDGPLGWTIATAGMLLIALGIVLVWARSRLKTPL